VRIKNPGDGSIGETTRHAFEKVWEPKGWTIDVRSENDQEEKP
jgi:hypothetical protein